MPTDSSLISTVVAGLVLSFIFGAIANRLRLPPLVGYLIAGVVVGPFTPGFVADVELALELSEIGVILLMFGVGLNFSMKDLLSVQAVAIPGALGRIAGATVLGIGLAWLMGWPLFAGLIFGLALSVASTVVLLKALQDRHMIDSERGRIAVGWVIVEDIAMVLALVLIPAFAGIAVDAEMASSDPFVGFVERIINTDIGLGGVIAITVLKLAAFVGFMFVVGRRLIPMVLHLTAHTGSRELFRLAVLAIALGVAAGSAYLFGVSLALGAFFAGMILSESELSQRAAQESLPLRDAFAVLFFVSVGMLFDPTIFLSSPLPVLGVLFIILVGKTALAFGLMLLFRKPAGTSLMVAVSLAQVGEFSFILAALGVGLGIMPEEGRDLILSGAIVSIILNPLLFWGAEKLKPTVEGWFQHPPEEAGPMRSEPELVPSSPTVAHAHPEPAVEEPADHRTALTGHTILAGYGRVGAVIGQGLLAAEIPFVLIEDAEGRVATARASGIEVIEGNAATSKALAQANVTGASTVIIAIPNAFEAGQATEQSRRLNPHVRIVARAHSDEEEGHLIHLGADAVVMGEREIGLGMLSLLHDQRADAIADALKHAEVPVHTDVPNPIPANTSSPIEAALTDETFEEVPAPEMWADEVLREDAEESSIPLQPEIPPPPPSPIVPPVDPVPASPLEIPPDPHPDVPPLPPELPPDEPPEIVPVEEPPAPPEPAVPDPGPGEPPAPPQPPPPPESGAWHEDALDPWGDRDGDEPEPGAAEGTDPKLSPVVDIEDESEESGGSRN